MLAALLSHLKGDLQNALNLRTGVDIGIVSLVVVLIFLTKVHATRQFAQHHEVGTTKQLVLQRRLVEQTVERSHRTHVGKESELLTHGQQALFGTHERSGIVVVFQVADGSKEHSIGLHANLVGGLRIRVANCIDGTGTDKSLLVSKYMVELCSDGIHYSHALLHDLGTYSIARENGNFEFHCVVLCLVCVCD